MNQQQELLLGEQTPSPSLSRSSSVSSVLMVSNVTFLIIIDYFHIFLLTKYCPIPTEQKVINIFIFLSWAKAPTKICLIFFSSKKSPAGPKHPPLCQPRCSRGEDDAAPADKNPTTGGKGWRKDKDKVDVQKQNQF